MENQKPRKLELTEEQLAKVKAMKARHEPIKVDPETLFVAEFGYYFGWAGVCAIRNNEISLDDAKELLQGAIKVSYGKLVQDANIMYMTMVASRSKKGSSIMSKNLAVYKRLMKADK